MKIEKNVPVPSDDGNPKPGRGKRKFAHLFEAMEPGDSLFFPGEKLGHSAYSTARAWFVRREMGYKARVEDDGFRIWRTR